MKENQLNIQNSKINYKTMKKQSYSNVKTCDTTN